MSNKKTGSTAPSLFARMALRAVTVACIALFLAVAAYFAVGRWTRVTVEKKHSLVERELLECEELVLYKMRYSDIITLKKRSTFSKAFSIVRYSGIIRAGIENISDSQIAVSPDGKSVSVVLPPSVLLGNEIFSQEVFDEQQRIFNRITTQEIFDEINSAKEEAAQDFVQEGLLKEADDRAVELVQKLLLPLGFKSVSVKVGHP